MRRLEGKRIALTGPRKAAELSIMVEKLGGIPVVRPTQGTVAIEREKVEKKITDLIENGTDWIIFTTGVGTEMLVQAAESMGVAEAFIDTLRRTQIAARGYKTVKYLKSLGLEPTVRDDDGTTVGILRALKPYDLHGRRVALQLYGDHAPRLVGWLGEQQAQYYEILPYVHVPPEMNVINKLLSEIVEGELDAVTFTSTPQVRFLMSYAREKGLADRLADAFRGTTVAVAVGKVTAEALRDEGIQRVVAPEEERMGSMIVSLAKYYEEGA
ncbi:MULTISPECIES: uroporphyrinogen-III synthase [unclassified Paenibacillus]|uniref:uroporphyrinogen-III synthase n=1 Tax=unclassified Paenibacillus TaxID=185978 RepID=UPI001AE3F85A|nr:MULTISPECIES: uroporphyrinogen-III synthase [unclassified Paenibacillus]MBP1156864.1 uroporphyrinogen-III synthase [Paenibacillus sp. PvP091]MBP1172397.1 uroporphyrinogen-III synthase [Paenibacillus sp. PvR098]MBP2438778.1 uroporphyrinogen-III synthase [Paenibacillus sp. PvP052]